MISAITLSYFNSRNIIFLLLLLSLSEVFLHSKIFHFTPEGLITPV